MSTIPVLSGVGLVVSLTALVGYCYTVILGMPGAGSTSRRIAKVLGIVLAACAVILVAAIPFMSFGMKGAWEVPPLIDGWTINVYGLVLDIAIFLPFFVATHVIDIARQIKGYYKPLDYLGTFLGLYFGLFGGLLYVHRLVREVTEDHRDDG